MKPKEQAVRRDIWRGCAFHSERMKIQILDADRIYHLLRPHFKFDDKIRHQAVKIDLSKKMRACTEEVMIDWGCEKGNNMFREAPTGCKHPDICCVACPRLRVCYDEKNYCRALKEKGVIEQWAVLGEWKYDGARKGKHKRRK